MTEVLIKWAGLQRGAAVQPGWRTPAAVLSATGLVALAAHIALPLGSTPVPVTMQTFAVLLIGLLLSPWAAFSSLALYLAEGAVGLPVFAPGLGGFSHLLGPTGGYLLAYPLAAAMASFFYRYARRGFFAAVMGAAVGSVFILTVGAAWLEVLSHAQFSALFAESIIPFLLGDALKVLAAASCASVLDKFRGSRTLLPSTRS